MEYRAPIFQEEYDRGVAAGIAESEVKGEAKALILILTQKFGPLPDHFIDQITSATQDQLEQWLKMSQNKDTLDHILS